MSGDSVSSWLNAAGRAPLLTPDEEIHLAGLVWAAKAEDPTRAQLRAAAKAKTRMITGNLRLVVAVAKKYLPQLKRTQGLEMADLLQEGVIGLNRAVEKFDPLAGYKFSTYAYWWVRQSIGRIIQVQGRMVYLPSSSSALLTKAHFAPAEARRTRETLREYLGATKAEMARLDDALLVATVGSLDALVPRSSGDDDKTTVSDLIADPNSQPSLEQLDRELALQALHEAGFGDDLALLELKAIDGASYADLAELQGHSPLKMKHQLQGARQQLAEAAAPHRDLIAA